MTLLDGAFEDPSLTNILTLISWNFQIFVWAGHGLAVNNFVLWLNLQENWFLIPQVKLLSELIENLSLVVAPKGLQHLRCDTRTDVFVDTSTVELMVFAYFLASVLLILQQLFSQNLFLFDYFESFWVVPIIQLNLICSLLFHNRPRCRLERSIHIILASVDGQQTPVLLVIMIQLFSWLRCNFDLDFISFHIWLFCFLLNRLDTRWPWKLIQQMWGSLLQSFPLCGGQSLVLLLEGPSHAGRGHGLDVLLLVLWILNVLNLLIKVKIVSIIFKWTLLVLLAIGRR